MVSSVFDSSSLLITLMRSLESDHSLGLPDFVLLGTRLESFEVVGAHLGLACLEAEEEVLRYLLMRGLYGGRYHYVRQEPLGNWPPTSRHFPAKSEQVGATWPSHLSSRDPDLRHLSASNTPTEADTA